LAAPISQFGSSPRIVEILVIEGDFVKKGDILAIFENGEKLISDLERKENYIILSNSMNKPHGMRECYILDNNGFCWVPSILV